MPLINTQKPKTPKNSRNSCERSNTVIILRPDQARAQLNSNPQWRSKSPIKREQFAAKKWKPIIFRDFLTRFSRLSCKEIKDFFRNYTPQGAQEELSAAIFRGNWLVGFSDGGFSPENLLGLDYFLSFSYE